MELKIILNQKPDWLDIGADIATILGVISVFCAILGYLGQKRRDKLLAIVDQVSFFREKILEEAAKMHKHIEDQIKDYVYTRISLKEHDSVEKLEENYNDKIETQLELVERYTTLTMQINILNMLEEFSLRLIYSKTYKHPAFDSVKPAFVELVERLALVLVMQKQIITGNKIFSKTLILYRKWVKDVDGLTTEERVRKFQNEHF